MTTSDAPPAWNNGKGEYVRIASTCRDWIKPDTLYPPAAGRYHLFISYACPWASRCLVAIQLKGLEDVIGTSTVHPVWQLTKPDTDEHAGWTFVGPKHPQPFYSPSNSNAAAFELANENEMKNPLNDAQTVRELYEIAKIETKKYTVPILWDTATQTIVNNESSEILRILNSEFQALAKYPEVDLYPEGLRDEIDAVNARVYESINNGVYRCGFASTQSAYDEAIDALYESLEHFEQVLSKQRYLTGAQFTEADLRLFVTLIRFDEVYAVHFKTNKKMIREYPNLFNFTKEIYQMPGLSKTVNMDHIKLHYYGTHGNLNKFGIIPRGPGIDFGAPHDRELIK
eukprot:CAMPEP_0201125510 /NCGR_PEP_ID=MMETSP0850-20130426/21699_1 /ASSEMBLY_ACC=CAM_ASM_000622 /TAXON_ID=183588 /ORGANISM="Pseudo-nitzschia fraudulenta, Strain WWA7" /LENGTH=341 /DNA_ID=CAMNT_0047393559 /DNA_START=386 /DNA_END=1411 /DNA_ORIENTATION=-